MSLAPLQLSSHLAYLWGRTLVIGGDTLQLDVYGRCADARVDLRETLLQSADWSEAPPKRGVEKRHEATEVPPEGPELTSGLRDRPQVPDRLGGLKDRRFKDRH